MWAWAVSTVAILLALAIVSAMPIRGRASGVLSDDEISGAAELGWGFGFLRLTVASGEVTRVVLFGLWSFPVSRRKRPSKDERKRRRKRKPTSKRRRWVSVRKARPGVVVAMVRELVSALHVRVFFGGRLGLADPADAATLEAATRLSREMLPMWLELDLRSEPFEESIELLGRVGFWVLPAEVLGVLASWMLRPDTRRVLRALA